jgi:transposase-like protein
MNPHFTPEKRERYLTLIETGRTGKEAAEAVSISRTTVNKWVRAGRLEGAQADKRQFAERFDALRTGPQDNGSLTQADLVRLLEISARTGSVSAMKLLLERPWEKKQPEEEKPAPVLSLMDKLQARRAE